MPSIDTPTPEQAVGWLEIIKDYPAILTGMLIGLVVGVIVMYILIRKGFISTPAMKAQMEALHKENEDLRIEVGVMQKEMTMMRENDRKYQALVDRVMTAYQIELPESN